MPTVGVTHHIKLAGAYYMLKPGSYSKRQAPQFGARFQSGDPDFNNLSLWQHWAQRCWVGGMDAPEFADDAMFDDSVGIDTTTHERMTLGRSLERGTGSNWTVSSGGAVSDAGSRFCIYNGKLYVITWPSSSSVEGHLWEYNPSTDGWTRITSLDGANVSPRSICVFDGKLFIGGWNSATGNTARLRWTDTALTTWTNIAIPSGINARPVTAMKAFQQKLYVAFNNRVWRLKDDETWDGNVIFYKVNAASDSSGITAMEVHLGFLYMLSSNGHVHRTDGNTTFDIWAWDGSTIGLAIRSFDGRLFIMTFEYTATTEVGYGVLYQMSGSAMTELKRWGTESKSVYIPTLSEFDRRLWYGASNLLGMTDRAGFGVVCYDPIEDAHSIHATNCDTTANPVGSAPYRNNIVEDIIYFGGFIFALTRGHGAFKTPHKFRDVLAGTAKFDITTAGGSVASKNGGWLTSSTYDAGTPGLLKHWRKVTIDYQLPPGNVTSIYVEYSDDNGASWNELGFVTSSTDRVRRDMFIETVQSVSFKLRFTLRSTDATKTPILFGWVVSYVPVPEPNWMWQFTIVLSEKTQLMDGTTETNNTESQLAALAAIWRNKVLVEFTDVDGTVWASNGAGVLPYDVSFWLPDLTQPLEGEVQVTLLEAVEFY